MIPSDAENAAVKVHEAAQRQAAIQAKAEKNAAAPIAALLFGEKLMVRFPEGTPHANQMAWAEAHNLQLRPYMDTAAAATINDHDPETVLPVTAERPLSTEITLVHNKQTAPINIAALKAARIPASEIAGFDPKILKAIAADAPVEGKPLPQVIAGALQPLSRLSLPSLGGGRSRGDSPMKTARPPHGFENEGGE